jgi:glucosamine--fructose-6-phosphate aminotransferase (isomerizing)
MMNLEKEIREQPQVLRNVYSANAGVFEKLISELKTKQIDSIYFAARGTSDHACIYAQYLFGIYLGLPCALSTPSVISKYNGALQFNNTLVIGVSQSGKAEDVISTVKRANENNTITVAITNNSESPLAKEAKYHLYCNAGDENSIAATKTFTSQMYLLALLCALWSGNKELSQLLDKVPGGVGDLLETIPGEIEKITARYADLKTGIVLARGLTYPIALEGALKVLETNHVKMKGYPISDFHHGPVAQVAENDFVIVLAAKGAVLDDAIEIIAKLKDIGADILVISDDSETVRNYVVNAQSLQIPDLGGDVVSPFLFAVVMQLFAQKLTIVKGIDPDVSKVIKKITITK